MYFFYYIGGAIAFVPSVGLGVDERTLDCELLLVLLIWKLFPSLRTLVGLVAFFVLLEFPLNLHMLMVSPIFEKDHVPH